jgi:hypothetical protein
VADRIDTAALPMTEPHHAPIFDTGPHPDPLSALASVGVLDEVSYFTSDFTDTPEPAGTGPSGPLPVTIAPVSVPGQFHFIKWWRFALMLAGVWVIAAAIGLAMYYRWFHAVDKTWPDFMVLAYVIVCMVAALLVGMAERTAMASALSIAVMSAPFASGCGAAALYGMYVFGWITP